MFLIYIMSFLNSIRRIDNGFKKEVKKSVSVITGHHLVGYIILFLFSGWLVFWLSNHFWHFYGPR